MQRPMFTKSGDPSRYLWHAIRQVIDWRPWVEITQSASPDAFEAGPDGLEFLAFGIHHDADGEPVDDPWIE